MVVPSPVPDDENSFFRAAEAIPGHGVYAAGYGSDGPLPARMCPLRVTDDGFPPDSPTVDFGTTVSWTFDPSNLQAHSVTDASGMGLFDSGSRPAGASYDQRFEAGGTYRVRDVATADLATIRVPITALPPAGGVNFVYDVMWATGPPPADFAYDVQIERPGAPGFLDWLPDTNLAQADFMPDAGPGIYAFRARIRNRTNGKATGWSPSALIEATGGGSRS
jgi:hypothetical protein